MRPPGAVDNEIFMLTRPFQGHFNEVILPHVGVGMYRSFPPGKKADRKAVPIRSDPVPEIPCTVAFYILKLFFSKLLSR